MPTDPRALQGLQSGDVIWVPFPNSDGQTYKLRPVMVIVNDETLKQLCVACVTKKLEQETLVYRNSNRTSTCNGFEIST